MKKLFYRHKKAIWYALSCVTGLLVFNSCLGAEDYAGSVLMPMVEANFGPTSSIAKVIYVAELLGGAWAYKKTKEASLFVGTPVVIGATYAGWSIIDALS